MKRKFFQILLIAAVLTGTIIHLTADTYGTCPICGGNLVFYQWIEQATCTENGVALAVCENHDYDAVVDTDPLGHDYKSKTVTEAACTTEGSMIYICQRCNDSYTAAIPALGHDYHTDILKVATCTAEGSEEYICSRCDDSYIKTVPALGHNYVGKVTKQATCEEDGTMTYTCSRCHTSYDQAIKATGHEIEYEEKAATCTENGYKKGLCKICGKEFNEILPKTLHNLGQYSIIKAGTCTDDGLETATCKICNAVIETVIPKTGHSFPAEWTIEKPAGYFTDGLESKTCSVCSEKIVQIVPHSIIIPFLFLLILMVVATVVIGCLFLIIRGKHPFKMTKQTGNDPENVRPGFENKTILVSSRNEDLTALLKSKHYLEAILSDYEELPESAKDNDPDLIVTDILSQEALEDILKKKEDVLSDYDLALVVSEELLKTDKQTFDKLQKDKTILSYVPNNADDYLLMTRLILPAMKPDLKSDESLENIGMVADLLGIPGISSLISTYVSGRDITSTLQEEKLGVSETATIISDIASILGMETLSSVAGLVDDVESIKAAADKEAGAHEGKNAITAIKDIADVVSDLSSRK